MSSENNNNDNKDKKDKTERTFYQFMGKQGFYIILTLCLIIVAATALWVNNQGVDYFIGGDPTIPFDEDERPEVILVEDDEDSDKGDETKETGKIGEGKPAGDAAEGSGKDKDSVKDKETSAKDSKEKPGEKADKSSTGKDGKNAEPKQITVKKDSKTEQTEGTATGRDRGVKKVEENPAPKDSEFSITEDMAVPVMGKLTLPFADDRLVYHKTLDQWSTHKGIDIQADEGAPVKAVLDGEVVEILNDTIMGISIVIKHDNELLTMYSNLSTDAMVEVGEQVKKGQIISAVGKTAPVKTLEGPLLHFQVLRDDKFVNPELYLGDISV